MKAGWSFLAAARGRCTTCCRFVFLLIAVKHKLHRRFARFKLYAAPLPFDFTLRFPGAGHRTVRSFSGRWPLILRVRQL
ncbi:MAG: hypothetical protein IPM82_32675 [Saprospiraceae bacterium]|nr:hypothetical protein [Saprospiraceae bacterium]